MGYILFAIGVLFLAGTVGSADQDLIMPIWQIVVQGIVGLVTMGLGALLIASKD